MNELKPCPFCGGKAELVQDVRYPRPKCECKTAYEVVCNNTDCIMYHNDNNYYLSKKKAIEAWNKRAGEC